MWRGGFSLLSVASAFITHDNLAIGEQSRFRKLRIYTCPTGPLTHSLLDTLWQFCTTLVIWDRGPLASQPF